MKNSQNTKRGASIGMLYLYTFVFFAITYYLIFNS